MLLWHCNEGLNAQSEMCMLANLLIGESVVLRKHSYVELVKAYNMPFYSS